MSTIDTENGSTVHVDALPANQRVLLSVSLLGTRSTWLTRDEAHRIAKQLTHAVTLLDHEREMHT